MLYWPGSRAGNWISDAGFSVSYDGGFFGGTLGVGTTVKENRIEYTDPVGKFNTLKAWMMPFGKWFKFTAGIGIGSGYADSLGADPGMRIYNGAEQGNWNADRDPDNITQDQGVLLEGFIGPVTLALAGRYYNPTVFALSLNPTDTDENKRNTEWAYKDEKEFSYGARIGSEIGEWGKVNASYILEFSNYYEAQQNFYGADRDGNIVPLFGNTELTRHLFGARLSRILYQAIYCNNLKPVSETLNDPFYKNLFFNPDPDKPVTDFLLNEDDDWGNARAISALYIFNLIGKRMFGEGVVCSDGNRLKEW
jgi:hypothetical protein